MKKPIKEKLALSWHFLGFKQEELCEKLSHYLEDKNNHYVSRRGLPPWRLQPERTPNDQSRHLW
jgi:hypothetical protein